MVVKGEKFIKWSDYDIEFLKNNYNKMSYSEIANNLGKTTYATRNKLARLGLIRKLSKNKYRIENKIVYMDLYNKFGKKISEFMFDVNFLKIIQKNKWSLHSQGYACSKKGKLLVHRLIMNCPKDMFVDHINGNRLDNRISNLRVVTPSENSTNYNIPDKRSKTQTLGVFLEKNGGIFASISVNKKRIRLGMFSTKGEASDAYNFAKAYAHPKSWQALQINQEDIPEWIKEKIDAKN